MTKVSLKNGTPLRHLNFTKKSVPKSKKYQTQKVPKFSEIVPKKNNRTRNEKSVAPGLTCIHFILRARAFFHGPKCDGRILINCGSPKYRGIAFKNPPLLKTRVQHLEDFV